MIKIKIRKVRKRRNKKIKISIKNNEDNEDLLNSSFDENTLLKDIFSKIKYDKNRDYDILDENMQKLNNKLDLKLKEIFFFSNFGSSIFSFFFTGGDAFNLV